MPITRVTTKVTWSAANTATVAPLAAVTSDIVTLDATCVEASITIKQDVPLSVSITDVIEYYWSMSSGDPDGSAAADEYDTYQVGLRLMLLNGLDINPAIKTVYLPNVPRKGQLVAYSPTSAKTITIGAVIEEMRVS